MLMAVVMVHLVSLGQKLPFPIVVISQLLNVGAAMYSHSRRSRTLLPLHQSGAAHTTFLSSVAVVFQNNLFADRVPHRIARVYLRLSPLRVPH